MTVLIRIAAAIAVSLGVMSSAFAASIECSEAWAAPLDDTSGTASVFLTLTNKGGEADRLLKIKTPVALLAQVHVSHAQGDAERMKRMKNLELAPGEQISLQNEDMHIMLVKVKEPLAVGAAFPLTLVFQKAGAIETSVTVRGAGMTHGH